MYSSPPPQGLGNDTISKSAPTERRAAEEKGTIRLHRQNRADAHGKPISRAILRLINVALTISFVSFHIAFQTTPISH